MEEEIVKSELKGRSILIALDANSKLESDYIPGDLHGLTKKSEIIGQANFRTWTFPWKLYEPVQGSHHKKKNNLIQKYNRFCHYNKEGC